MTTETLGYFEIASNLPPAAVVTFHEVSWEEYEQLIEELGEARGRRVSYNDGTLEIMTVSSEHESYADFIKLLIGHLSFRLRINIRFFGSATMRNRKKAKANEPDGCFYVQSAPARQPDSNRFCGRSSARRSCRSRHSSRLSEQVFDLRGARRP
jgi:Uma2 family endonuclease